MAISLEVYLLIAFVVLLSLVLFLNRKKLSLEKIAFPLLYLILYRTKFGLNLMDRWAKKYNGLVKNLGYACIGFSFIGMLVVSFSLLWTGYQYVAHPQQNTPGVALVLPFTNIPGIGYLPFVDWILCIFILAVIHEFAHGIVARAHGVPVKSSGFGVMCLFAPLIPLAFVEPDEEHLKKKNEVVKYSVFAVGPMINIALAVLLLLAFPYVADLTDNTPAPFENSISEPVGFSFALLNDSLPAAQAGFKGGEVVSKVNGEPMKNADAFLTRLSCVEPGTTLNLSTANATYHLTTVPNPSNAAKGFLGITQLKHERKIKPGMEPYAPFYYWLRGFLRWLYLLNFFIGLANLLPLGFVDGGRIMETLLHSSIGDENKARKVWVFIGMLCLFLIAFGLIVGYLGNPFG
ncbi:site-2 protease family protein [Candidatus Woesearchaeota archaeon]|nr:site-2 protease family protein [Candidatus Woesearchaeota archaeon]